jgi:hypothetical protein
MATQTGRRSTYESTVGLRLDIEDAIHMISPFEVPFLGTYGPDRGSVLGKDSTTSTKVEWLEDELVPGSDALAATHTAGDAYITVDNREYFKTNDLIRIDDEFMRVTDPTGTTAATMEVERSWGDPAAAGHADGATVLILGNLPQEGDDPVSGINFNRTQPFNYTQIYQDEVEVTRSEEKEAKYGVRSESAYQIGKRYKENAIKLEKNLILGTRAEDTTNKRRSHGGLDYYLSTGTDSSTTQMTEDALLDALQASFDRGGMVDLLAVGGTQKRVISAFSADDIRIARDDNVRGAVVDWYDSDFGRIYVVLNRWIPTRFAFGLEKQYIDVVWFDPFFTEMLAKTGDRQQWEIVAEVTMRVRNEKAHFKFTALT